MQINHIGQGDTMTAYDPESGVVLKETMADRIIAESEAKRGQFSQLRTTLSTEVGLLKIRTANQCLFEASQRPVPKMLCDEFWHEGELCILFADTNQGKSILAVQIADSISRGQPIPGLRLEATKQVVIYLDCELSDKQFENRYSENYANPYHFDDNLMRVELNPDAQYSTEHKTSEDYLLASLEQLIQTTGCKVVIIDNITFMAAQNEQAKDALPLMKILKALKDKYDLSMLVLAHTPKRDLHKPLSRNDIQGSKMIVNFCDSAFAIGESQQAVGLRYLKQIKVRAAAERYGADNVIVCQIVKDSNFLCFNKVDYGQEWEHLKAVSGSDLQAQIQETKAMKAQGKTNVEIAAHYGITEGAVRKRLKSI